MAKRIGVLVEQRGTKSSSPEAPPPGLAGLVGIIDRFGRRQTNKGSVPVAGDEFRLLATLSTTVCKDGSDIGSRRQREGVK